MFSPSLQRFRRYLWAAAVLSAVVGAVVAVRLDGPGRATASVRHGPAIIHRPGEHWMATWAASPQAPIAGNLSERGFADQTVREIVDAGAGGAMVRVRLSNAFGDRPLRIAAASVARQREGAELAAGTARALSFGGRTSVVIGAGRAVASDPVVLRRASRDAPRDQPVPERSDRPGDSAHPGAADQLGRRRAPHP